MQLHYFVPFKAQEGVSAEFALRERLVNIEGIAIDTSVNANKWQIPEEDLDFFAQSLQGAQLRVDHAESALMVVGKIAEAKRVGTQVLFRAEVGDVAIIEKILRNYVSHVSAQVDSDVVECSKCMKPTRKEGMLVHLCPGAWEIVHKPKVRELSIVASPAYQTTEFKPVGFAAAMNESQKIEFPCAHCSQLLKSNEDVGSKRELQEPENKKSETKEVKPLSDNAQAKASPHQAQGVVNVAPGESAPKQVEYEDLMNQTTQLLNKINQSSSASDAENDALKAKVAELEGAIAKRATKSALSKKISELSKKLCDSGIGAGEDAEDAGTNGTNGDSNGGDGDGQDGDGKQKAEAKRASGHGQIGALDEANKDVLGNYAWFKDLMKASNKMKGMK